MRLLAIVTWICTCDFRRLWNTSGRAG